MSGRVELWWARRQFSKGTAVPYPVGTYRQAWEAYPMLIRQYHPELNAGITLTQIPPAADVLLCWECDAGHRFAATPAEQRRRPGRVRRRSAWCPECSILAHPPAPATARPTTRRQRKLCTKTPDVAPGTPFVSRCAPAPASAVEARLRAALHEGLTFDPAPTAVRTAQPFFEHSEVWPDVVVPELRIAVEYDSIGRHGLEHVGRREQADLRKDRLLRAVGWEVVRVRTGKLRPLGPYDVSLTSVNRRAVDAILDVFVVIRGEILVAAYRR